MFSSVFNESIIKRAQNKNLIEINVHNIREFTDDKHKTVDDKPYGGGCGMLMKVEPIVRCIEAVKAKNRKSKVILTSASGEKLTHTKVVSLSALEGVIIVCGRYEGVDERVKYYVDEEISIGDFVLTGGEIAAMAIVDSTSRQIPGVLGSLESLFDSYSNDLLEYPQYTSPRVFRGHPVPDVLVSGNHEAIKRWRTEQSVEKTKLIRPDLFRKLDEH